MARRTVPLADAFTRVRGRLALDRRTLLRGMLGGAAVSLALPPLEAMFDANGTAYALDGVLPKRFGLFFWGNGNRPERWVPSSAGVGAAWELSETLQPLAALKSKLTVVSGMAVKLPNDSPHGTGSAGILSAAPMPFKIQLLSTTDANPAAFASAITCLFKLTIQKQDL